MLFYVFVAVLLASVQAKYYTDCGKQTATRIHQNTEEAVAFISLIDRGGDAYEGVSSNPAISTSTPSTLQKVHVSGCTDNAKECILKRYTNVTISLDFIPTKKIRKLDTGAHLVINNFPVYVPLPQPDACKNTGLSCPLKAGEVASYKSTLQVWSYPKIKMGVKWELKFNDEDVVCILIHAKVK